ncbi:MAG: hypothetical protein JNL67_14865 [Planctomycetaceae bacterium]|nr:hypothetical protein [Planctomycetaceae bacterium]
MTTPLRKYHKAAGLSSTAEERLQRLEQRFEQLDAELSAVELVIQQQFPTLGLTEQETFETLVTPQTCFTERHPRAKRKPK